MKKYYYILTLGLLAGLASCSDEAKQAVEPDSPVKTYTQFYANIVDELGETRSLLVNDKKTYFETGDAINLFVDEDITTGLNYTLGYQSTSNTFDVDPGYAPITGSQFNAIFPVGAAFNSDVNKYVINLPHNFIYRRDTFSGTQSMPLWGASTGGSNVLNFTHMAGLIRIALSGSLQVTQITLKGNNGEQIGGAAEIDYTQATPVLQMATGYLSHPAAYEQVMTVKETNPYVELTQTPTYFYFVVPPITFTKGITIIVDAKGLHHPVVKTTSSPVTVGRGVMKTFSSVDTDEILNAEADLQLEALKALYNSTNGANWTNKWDITKPLSDTSSWPGVTADANGVVTAINLSGNNLTGTLPAELGDLKYLTTLNLSNNSIEGGIPKEVKNMSSLVTFNVSNNLMNDSVPYAVYTSDVWAYANKSLAQSGGNALKTKYVSNNYADDNTLNQLNSSITGSGIPIIITCDGYTDGMKVQFDIDADYAKDYFFSTPPYSDFINYFNVYSLFAVSPNDEPDLNLAYGTKYTDDSYWINTSKVRERLENLAVLGNSSSNVLTIVLLNEPSGDPNRAICFTATDGFAAAIIPVDSNMEKIIHHEAGGHGFAFLADEYSSDGSFTFTNNVSLDGNGDPIDIDALHASGFDLNVDYKNTNTTAVWKDFWNDASYASEAVGAFPGGMGIYTAGIYHSTAQSTMNNQDVFDKFNPISRFAIFKQILKRAGYAEPNFATFKAYDVSNVSYMPPVSVMTRNYVEKDNFKLGAPPVWIK